MSKRRNRSYSPNVNMPGSSGGSAHRGPAALLLTLLIPPVGLIVMWRKNIFRTRGRVLITALATLEMACLMMLLMPRPSIDTAMPIPGEAPRITPAPESEVLTALSNMDRLLRDQQIIDQGGTPVNPIDQEAQMAAQREILDTVVYSVYDSGARFYHKDTVCGNQSNLRSLTVEEAIAEGLGPCPDCHPPVYSALGTASGGDNPGEAPANPGEAPANPGEVPANPGEAPAGEVPVNPGEAPAGEVPVNPGEVPADPQGAPMDGEETAGGEDSIPVPSAPPRPDEFIPPPAD